MNSINLIFKNISEPKAITIKTDRNIMNIIICDVGIVHYYSPELLELYSLAPFEYFDSDCKKEFNISLDYTHFKDNDSHKIYLNFYNEYKNNIKNPMILGYYCHLYADYSFNNFAYPILNNNESFKNYTKDELRRFKQDEFKRYNTNFSDNNITIYDCNEILEETKKINRVKIYKGDIIKVSKYLNNGENIQNLNFFNKNDFDILIGDIVNEIKNFYFNNK